MSSVPSPEDGVRGRLRRLLLTRPLFARGTGGLRYIQIIALLVVTAALVLPAGGFGVSFCIFYSLFGLPCPGCGMTRSIISFYHLDPAGSWHFHPLGPSLALVFGLAAFSAFSRRLSALIVRRRALWVGILIVWTVVWLAFGFFRAWWFHHDPSEARRYLREFKEPGLEHFLKPPSS